jgi:hypothetical protein
MPEKTAKGIVRALPPDDPRSLAHPSHREQWLELAGAIGRMEARDEFARMKQHQKDRRDDEV